MPALSEQQLDTIREQLEHLLEATSGDWRALDDLGKGVEFSRTIVSRIKDLPSEKEQFKWYKAFGIPANCLDFRIVGIEHDERLPLAYCDELTLGIEGLCGDERGFEVLKARLLLNQTGELMADQEEVSDD